jgi:hypothetical protein
MLYRETSCELSSARWNKKYSNVLLYSIKYVLDYLCRQIPPTIQSTTVYPFISSTSKEWDSLDISVRNVDFLNQFKTELRNMDPHKLRLTT